jgi:hypothetical protein
MRIEVKSARRSSKMSQYVYHLINSNVSFLSPLFSLFSLHSRQWETLPCSSAR